MQTLRRDLGLIDAVGIGFGAIVGAGIFVVTGVAAGIAGPAILLALAIAGVAATANALSSAELAAQYPQSGGTYEYGYQLLGPAWGFAAGWMFLASKITAAGTVALGMAGYLERFLPQLAPRVMAISAIIVFTLLNYFGIKRSSRANLVIVAISIGSLLLFIVAGVPSLRSANLHPFMPSGWRATMEASALLFFAYTGYARIATLAEEVRDPGRTIPRAIVITIGAAIILYLAVAAVALMSASSTRLAATNAPLAVAADTFAVNGIGIAVSVGGVAAMLGVILSQLLGLSRMAYAMARRGDLPHALATVHPRYGVPGRAVLIIGAVTAIVAASGGLRWLAASAAFTILIYYAIANAAALRLPREARLVPSIVPVVGFLVCVGLAMSLPLRVIVIGVVTLAAGFVVRLVVRSISGE